MKIKIIFVFFYVEFSGFLNGQKVPKQVEFSPTYVLNLNQVDISQFTDLYHEAKSLNYFQNDLFSPGSISQSCELEIEKLFKGLTEKEQWSLKTIDSFAKPPSGLLKGNINWLGEYTECLDSKNISSNCYPKYCTLNKKASQFESQISLNLKYGFCAPMNCSSNDLAEIFNYIFLKLAKKNLSFVQDDIICQNETNVFDTPAWIFIVTISCLVGLVLLASLIHLIMIYKTNPFASNTTTLYLQINEDNVSTNLVDIENLVVNTHVDLRRPIMEQIIHSFSLISNFKKIFNFETDDNHLLSLNGIRVISLGWVILSHTFGFTVFYSDNPLDSLNFLKRFLFSIVSNGFFSVDSFFLISGVLTGYLFIKNTARPNFKLTYSFMLKYYLNRFLRLSPSLYVMLFFTIFMTKYIGYGPMYPNEGLSPTRCRTDLWKDLLYLSNFAKINETCFGINWYLSNDIQFHFMAPVILIPLALNKFFIGILLLILILIGNLVSIFLTLYNNPGTELGIYGTNSEYYFEWVYLKPWTRCGPFLIGIFIGFILYFHKRPSYDAKIKKIYNLINWNIAQNLIGLCIFALYQDFKIFPDSYYTQMQHIIYQTFSRLIWALSVGYFIYACETKNGGIISNILSWKLFIPLARLSYSAFLVHFTYLFYFLSTQNRLFNLQELKMVYYFIGNFIGSYVLGTLLCIFVEMPFNGLQTIFIK
ncbi:unnamed protein product [Brachionus calyciflorus]|uniref:Nose resistant-to-fluoxetine protein N-terminal domain-containing protein n=1 Tax=Brachionus calyciflorus TaxID=104777 RepID=A0A814EYI8_9BILA|nr:unnamed protein product [Brachionus calyciflorus]